MYRQQHFCFRLHNSGAEVPPDIELKINANMPLALRSILLKSILIEDYKTKINSMPNYLLLCLERTNNLPHDFF